jgi:lysophospholipase L1-like esterase
MVIGMWTSRTEPLLLAALAVTALDARAAAQPTVERASNTSHTAPDQAEAEPGQVEVAPVFGTPIELYDPSGRALQAFHDSLRRTQAGEDQSRIVFYGASHVASDLFTNVVRETLQARFGDAGHGFIMPAQPWRHYRHGGGITVESSRRWHVERVDASTRDVNRLGLAGIALESDSANEWGRVDTGTHSAGRFEIYFWRRPRAGAFDVFIDGQRVQRVSTAGDEEGPDFVEIHASDAPHVLEIRPRGDGVVRLFGVSVEREAPGVILDTLGVNGARATAHLHWDEELHRTHLRRVNPAMVVLAYGTNESGDDDRPIDDYETTLRAVVARIRGTVPQASCLLIGPSDRPLRLEDGTYGERPRTHAIIDVQRRVSRDFGCAFFDLVEFGGGPGHMVQWAAAEPAFAQPDFVHYTVRGYRRLGEVLHGALMSRFEASPESFPSTIASGPPR